MSAYISSARAVQPNDVTVTVYIVSVSILVQKYVPLTNSAFFSRFYCLWQFFPFELFSVCRPHVRSLSAYIRNRLLFYRWIPRLMPFFCKRCLCAAVISTSSSTTRAGRSSVGPPIMSRKVVILSLSLSLLLSVSYCFCSWLCRSLSLSLSFSQSLSLTPFFT